MSPEDWRKVRRYLIEHRPGLTAAADRRYPDASRVAGTRLLTRPPWLPGLPLDLARVALGWVPQAAAPVLDGTEPAASVTRPPGFGSYAEAVAGLAAPAVFEDRVCYRLLSADLTGARLDFGPGSYFAALNVGEAAAHELAASPAGDLPFRGLAGDPTDLARRCAVLAISTLTIRHERDTGRASFILHWRDPAKVAHAGGLYQVMPVGVFQPSADSPADFDLWRCMVREFSEELLGHPEHQETLDYATWPFHQALMSARRSGRLGVHCLGLGVDPLTFATDLLTVAVFDSEVFDEVFRDLVDTNAEGEVTQIPFTADSISPFINGRRPTQPAGAAALTLAWQHREPLGLA